MENMTPINNQSFPSKFTSKPHHKNNPPVGFNDQLSLGWNIHGFTTANNKRILLSIEFTNKTEKLISLAELLENAWSNYYPWRFIANRGMFCIIWIPRKSVLLALFIILFASLFVDNYPYLQAVMKAILDLLR